MVECVVCNACWWQFRELVAIFTCVTLTYCTFVHARGPNCTYVHLRLRFWRVRFIRHVSVLFVSFGEFAISYFVFMQYC